MNSFLGQIQHTELSAEHVILHKRGLKIASSYCEGRTCERAPSEVSHRWPEVHHCLAVCRFGLSYASHWSCKEKATVLPECSFPIPNGCDQQPQDPNCHSLLEIMRFTWQKPRVKATSHNAKGYYQHIPLVSAKGTPTGGSLLQVDPWGKCHSAERLSQVVAAKVTKDKDLPVEHAQLMRAENWNILMTSQMGMLIKVATWGSFLVWQPIEKLWWDVTNRPWRCFHLLWHGPCFGQNKHEKELQTDLHVWVQFSETCFGKRALWFLYGKEVCDNLRD